MTQRILIPLTLALFGAALLLSAASCNEDVDNDPRAGGAEGKKKGGKRPKDKGEKGTNAATEEQDGPAARTGAAPAAAAAVSIDPVFVAIVIHSEEDVGHNNKRKGRIPDYDGDAAAMRHYGMALREFGRMAQEHGAKINYGTDWTFARGVSNHDPDFFKDWVAMGHEVDAHAHESHIMYDEVVADIAATGVTPSRVISGVVEQNIQERTTWLAEHCPAQDILWGVAQVPHDSGECVATWVWRPSRSNWLEHDPNGRFIYVPNGNMVNNFDEVQAVVENRRANAVNTYSLFVAARNFKADSGGLSDSSFTASQGHKDHWQEQVEYIDGILDEIDREYVSKGLVQYASLTEIADIFAAHEDELAAHASSEVPRSAESYPVRKKKAEMGR